MKIAVLTDTHWGIRGDHDAFYSNFEKFYGNIFFPVLKDRSIKHVFHLGDLYDRRRYINFRTASEADRIFLKPLSNMVNTGEITDVTILAGNHDLYYRNVNDINSLNVLLGQYNFNVLTNPKVVTYGTRDILFLPWICDSNKALTDTLVTSSNATVAMGHLELSGYEMYRGVVQDHGMDADYFSRFKSVYSGHYHHKSTKKNITYLGATGEYTWSDYNDPRGFHIYDTEDDSMEFIENPYTMFNIITYDDKEHASGYKEPLNVKDKFVKVLVINKTNPYIFDKFADALYKAEPLDVQIIEDGLLNSVQDSQTEETDLKDTLEIISDSVESMTTNLDKTILRKQIISLYNEALAIGNNE